MEWTDRNGSTNAEAIDDAGVLIVDDDRDCRQMLKMYFEMEGFRATCATNGNEALVLLKSSPFCLMLTDYNMPGMNGLKLSEEALKAAPGLIIVMITGDHLAQLKHKAAKLGITAVLAKPLNTKELFSLIRLEDKRRIAQHSPEVHPA